jgi:hypothetical protein
LTSQLGGLTLPIPAGVANSEIDDPVVSGLAAYLAFYLNDALNTKLANLSGTSAEAVPSTNTFLWDPSTYFVRGRGDGDASPFPALYVWWDGRSQHALGRETLIYDCRERLISVMYLFEELNFPGAANARRGLLGAVDAVFFKAGERWRHASFSLGTDALNSWLLHELNIVDLRYMGGTRGELKASIPEASARAGGSGEGAPTRGYPALSGQFRVWEQVEQDSSDEFAGDVELDIRACEGLDEPVDFMTRYLPGPDGSEEEP